MMMPHGDIDVNNGMGTKQWCWAWGWKIERICYGLRKVVEMLNGFTCFPLCSRMADFLNVRMQVYGCIYLPWVGAEYKQTRNRLVMRALSILMFCKWLIIDVVVKDHDMSILFASVTWLS